MVLVISGSPQRSLFEGHLPETLEVQGINEYAGRLAKRVIIHNAGDLAAGSRAHPVVDHLEVNSHTRGGPVSLAWFLMQSCLWELEPHRLAHDPAPSQYR